MKNPAQALFPLIGLLALSACGSGSSGIGDVPQSAVTPVPGLPMPEPQPVPVPGNTPPILALDPELVAKGVAPNGSIVLFSDRALDATTVETSLELRDAETTETVPASISYDGETQTITITPERNLVEDKQYALHLDGVRDTAGNAIPPSSWPVMGVNNRILRSRSIGYDEDGNITSFFILAPIDDATQVRGTSYSGPGLDGDWLDTDDNDVEWYYTKQYLPNQREIFRKYSAPGEDGEWFNDNDVLSRSVLTEKTRGHKPLRELASTDAGGDGDWFTSDDTYSSATLWVYEENGLLTRHIYGYSYPGESNIGPGSDKIWLTPDDQIQGYIDYEYDADGRREYSFQFGSAGADGKWFEDDPIHGINRYEYTESGQLARRVAISPAGYEHMWPDEELILFAYQSRQVGNIRLTEMIRPGADGKLDTPDDYLSSYDHDAFDAEGRPTAKGCFIAAGTDGVWHTEDDTQTSGSTSNIVYRYGINGDGEEEQQIIFLNGNGENGLRFDGDEPVDKYQLRGHYETGLLKYARVYQRVGETDVLENGVFRLSSEYEVEYGHGVD